MDKKKIVDIILNTVIIISIIGAVIWYYIPGHIDALGSSGIKSFRYFTTDSNILIAIASCIWVVTEIKMIGNKQIEIPKWIRILRYAATTAGALTLFEVLLFMSPLAFYHGGLRGVLRCYEDNVFVLHFLAPLLMIISFIFSDKEYKPNKKESLIALIPMAVYGTVYLVMVVILKQWPDFYQFTFHGRYEVVPVVIVVIFIATYIMATLLRKLKR